MFAPNFSSAFFLKHFVNLAFRIEIIKIIDIFFVSCHLLNMLQLLIKVKNYEFFQVKMILTQKQKIVFLFTLFPLLISFKIPDEPTTCYSCYKIIVDNDNEINNSPVEFSNSLTISGLSPHKLVLKVNCVVLLIRNSKTKKASVKHRYA